MTYYRRIAAVWETTPISIFALVPIPKYIIADCVYVYLKTSAETNAANETTKFFF